MQRYLGLLGLLLLNLPLWGQIRVCADCEIKTIREAVALAQPHDTIFVQTGVYQENTIIINKPLVLLGQGQPVIDGNHNGNLIEIKADSVEIAAFTIRNVGVSYTKDLAAILLTKADHFYIHDNRLEKVFFGILVEKSHHGRIVNNVVSSEAEEEFTSGNGIHLWSCRDVLIKGNELFGLRDGIYLEFVEQSTIIDNHSHDNIRYGLHFMFSNHDNYYDNTFERNGAGVAVMFSKFINMKRNRFYKNWGTASFGLLLKEIYDAEIENNVFEENTIAINIEGSTRVNYFHNDLIRNGWAVKVAGGCYANIFENNNFIDNSFDVSYNTKMNDNRFLGNYWSSYTGYDLDRDGIGDVPYRPVKLFSYIVGRTPETIILLRSLFIDILNFSEKVSPVFTPDNLVDEAPKMKITHD